MRTLTTPTTPTTPAVTAGGTTKLNTSDSGSSSESNSELPKGRGTLALGIGGKPRVVVISGPTAAGKTEVAIQLAQRIGGEIICADSVQVFRGMAVGSNAVPRGDMAGVPHHLLEFLDPSDVFSNGDFFRAARQMVAEVLGRGNVPILCGGATFYLRFFMYGLPASPKREVEVARASPTPEEREEWVLSGPGDWARLCGVADGALEPLALKALKGLHASNDWFRFQRLVATVRATGDAPPPYYLPSVEQLQELDYDFRYCFLFFFVLCVSY